MPSPKGLASSAAHSRSLSKAAMKTRVPGFLEVSDHIGPEPQQWLPAAPLNPADQPCWLLTVPNPESSKPVHQKTSGQTSPGAGQHAAVSHPPTVCFCCPGPGLQNGLTCLGPTHTNATLPSAGLWETSKYLYICRATSLSSNVPSCFLTLASTQPDFTCKLLKAVAETQQAAPRRAAEAGRGRWLLPHQGLWDSPHLDSSLPSSAFLLGGLMYSRT
jgi:hypothetical protein